MKRGWWLLLAILLLAGLLRLWQASSFDIYRDEAMNAYRAVGMFDFLGTDNFQTSPVNLYPQVPAWAKWSFHDAPPLLFWIWHIFFSLFGDNTFTLRLPFVIAALGLIYLIYYELKKNYSERAGLFGALILAISSYSVWTALSANHEGLLYLLISLSLFGFVHFFSTKKWLPFLSGSLFLALSLLTKYTAIFLLPVLATYILIWDRSLFKQKQFWQKKLVGVLLVVILLLPVIVYNYHTYTTRGHFDAALSSILGIKHEDFKGLTNRSTELSPIGLVKNLADTVDVLASNSSLPFFLLFVISAIFLTYRLISKQQTTILEKLTTLSLISLSLMFMFLPPATRYLSLYLPFMTLAIAIISEQAYLYLKTNYPSTYYKSFTTLLALILILELGYTLNTNVFNQPLGGAQIVYAQDRLYNLGFNNFNTYLRSNIYSNLPPKYAVKNQSDLNIAPPNIIGRPIVIYDDSINWSAWLWYFLRYQTYYKLPLLPTEYLMAQSNPNAFVNEFAHVSGKEVYYLSAVDPQLSDGANYARPEKLTYLKNLTTQLKQLQVPAVDIKNNQGETAFKLYTLKDSSGSYLALINFKR